MTHLVWLIEQRAVVCGGEADSAAVVFVGVAVDVIVAKHELLHPACVRRWYVGCDAELPRVDKEGRVGRDVPYRLVPIPSRFAPCA